MLLENAHEERKKNVGFRKGGDVSRWRYDFWSQMAKIRL